MNEQAIELPPLPAPAKSNTSRAALTYNDLSNNGLPIMMGADFDAFTADQMRAYARAAVLAEREMCARLCDELKEEHMESAAQNNGRQSDFAFGYVNAAEELAAAIRSGKPSP
jgi:hypothetical protein